MSDILGVVWKCLLFVPCPKLKIDRKSHEVRVYLGYKLLLFIFRGRQLSMGPQEDYIETVFTCEGDFDDPHLQDRLEDFQSSLKDLLLTGIQCCA